jgi:ornithine--oxo-acid transaminase
MNDFTSEFKKYFGEILTDQEVIDIDKQFGAQHYGRVDLCVHRWKGVWLYDRGGRPYFDCLAAYSAANQGHHHPEIKEVVNWALRNNMFSVISNVPYMPLLALFNRKISTMIPQLGPRFGNHGNKVLIKNGGVESVETALKIVSFHGYKKLGIKNPDGKQRVIVCRNNFHGRTTGVVAFSSTEKYHKGFGLGRNKRAYIQVDFGNLKQVEQAVKKHKKHICGIMVEPMQGEGGMYVPPVGYLRGLREIADKYDLMLVFDEIQVGLGRTGKMFCFEHEQVVPDVLIIGKALSGGLLPVSACVTNARVMDETFWPGRDGSTFGAYPGACVVGMTALNVITKERLVERSAEMGEILKAKIEGIAARSRHVKEVRGRGLFIGIEMKNGDAMPYCRKLLDHGMLVNDSHGHTIRISPPLILNENHIDYITQRLEKVLVD